MRQYLLTRNVGESVEHIFAQLNFTYRHSFIGWTGYSSYDFRHKCNFLENQFYHILVHYLPHFLNDELVPIFYDTVEIINRKKYLADKVNFQRKYNRTFDLLRYIKRFEANIQFQLKVSKSHYINLELHLNPVILMDGIEE